MSPKKPHHSPVAADPVLTPTAPTISGKSTTRYYLLALTGLWLIYYHRVLFGMSFLWEDVVEQMYPSLNFAVHCLKHGWFPFWTPYVFGGMPFSSDMLMPMLYPPHWLLLAVSMITQPGGISFTWYILLHVLAFGIGIFCLARSLGMERPSAFFAAVAGMFSASLTLNSIHTTYLYVVAWTPLVWMFYRRALQSGRLKDLLVAGLLLGLSILGSYPQPAIHFVYFMLAFTVATALTRRRQGIVSMIRPFVAFGVFAGLGLALAAAQYLPALEHMSQSLREVMTFDESCKGSVSPTRLFTLLAPRLFGFVGGDPEGSSRYWGIAGQSHFFWETTVFAGVCTILLVIRAVMGVRVKTEILFLTVMSGVLVLLCLGKYTPLYGLVFHWVPGFHNFRIPGRFTFWLSFCLVLLAGYGLDLLLKRDAGREKLFLRILAGTGGGLTLIALGFVAGIFDGSSTFFADADILKNSKAAMGVLLLTLLASCGLLIVMMRSANRTRWALALSGVVFVELLAFGAAFACGRSDPVLYFRRFSLATQRQELDAGFFRIQSRLYRGENRGEMLLPRNLGNIERVPLTEGYNQLMLKRYNDFLYKVDESVGRRLLCVRYKKTPGQPRVERFDDACSRFFVTGRWRSFGNQDGVIAYMNSPEFTPCGSVALESAPTVAPDTAASGTVRVVAENPNRVDIEVDATGNALLCMQDVYYPSWKAYVDGKKADLMPANLLFRAVPVASGKHRVTVVFESSALVRGILISLAGLVGTLAVLVFGKFVPGLMQRPWFGGESRSQQ